MARHVLVALILNPKITNSLLVDGGGVGGFRSLPEDTDQLMNCSAQVLAFILFPSTGHTRNAARLSGQRDICTKQHLRIFIGRIVTGIVGMTRSSLEHVVHVTKRLPNNCCVGGRVEWEQLDSLLSLFTD